MAQTYSKMEHTSHQSLCGMCRVGRNHWFRTRWGFIERSIAENGIVPNSQHCCVRESQNSFLLYDPAFLVELLVYL